MKTVIFANGDYSHSAATGAVVDRATLIIAADGGANHCSLNGIVPDIIIGDCDSIQPDLLSHYLQQDVTISRFPKEKDATDLELAIDYAVQQEAVTIDILGILGRRWDMSLSNILLCTQHKYSGKAITLYGEDCRIEILHPGVHTIKNRKEQRLSLLPIQGDALGVTLRGFEYSLSNATICFGSSLGVSNVITSEKATIEHTHGILLSIHQDG